MKKPEFQPPHVGTIEIRGIHGTRRTTGTILAAAAASILLGGCLQKEPPFEVTATENGAYLLNRDTGELKFIVGTRLLPVEAPSALGDALAQAKDWDAGQPSGVPGVRLTLRTKYRDGQMIYVASAFPFEGLLEDTRQSFGTSAGFSMHLVDAERFPMDYTIDLPLREGVAAFGADGERLSLQWSGSVPMSASTYAALSGVATGWRGFPAVK